MTEPRPRRRPSPAPVIWGSLALFAVLFTLLAYQLAAAGASSPRPEVRRKVIERRVVTTVVPEPGVPSAVPGAAEAIAPPAEEETIPVAPVITSAS